jgi:DNA-binding transcriptional LysR family regulator
LPPALGRFRACYPAVNLKLRIRNTSEVEKWVANGEVELGVVGDDDPNHGFASDPWLEDELIVLLNESHPLASRRTLPTSALAAEPCIAREEGSSTRRAAERVFDEHGLTLKPAMELGSTEAIREAVAAGLGFALVSKYAATTNDPRVVTARLVGVEWRRRFTLIRRASTPLGPAAARFREVLFESGRANEKVLELSA